MYVFETRGVEEFISVCILQTSYAETSANDATVDCKPCNQFFFCVEM